MLLVASLAAGALACHPPPPDQPTDEPDAPANEGSRTAKPALTSIEPACVAELDDAGVLVVGGQPTPLRVVEDPSGARIQVFGHGDTSVLVALGSQAPWLPFVDPSGAETLWEVACADPSEPRPFLHIDGADFSWAAQTPDGAGLYFSLGTVHRYDFAAGDYGPVTPPASVAECWMAEQPTPTLDHVIGWVGADRLLIYSGGPCGFEAEYEGGRAVIETATRPPTRRDAAPVTSVAVDAGGQLWASDGGACSQPETVWERGEPGLWRSADAGASWSFVAIPAIAGHGVEAIWAASDGSNALLARTECCYQAAGDEGCEGGELVLSDDGGVTWVEVSSHAMVGEVVSTVEHDGWIFEGSDDGLLRRRPSEPASVGEPVLIPGVTQLR